MHSQENEAPWPERNNQLSRYRDDLDIGIIRKGL